MSRMKILDNGTMRDATNEESTAIAQEIGGGARQSIYY